MRHIPLKPCLLLACLILGNGLLLSPTGSFPRIAAALILLLLPGLAWIEALLPDSDRLMRWSVGLGLSYTLGMVAGLFLHYLPGPVILWHELALLDAMVLVPLLVLVIDRRSPDRVARDRDFAEILPLLAILLLAALFRFAYLGYSEYQGDEIKAMLPAARALEGQQDALFFFRKKGPAEILLPMLLWRLTGTIDEGTSRLLFAIAGLLLVLTTYLLGQKMSHKQAGLIAALLLALNGFEVVFSRIVQYQSIVIWMSALALLCAWQWRDSYQARWAAMSGAFLGTGLLAHYDAIVIAPVLAYVALGAVSTPRPVSAARHSHSSIVSILVALGCLFTTTGLFYVPYLLNPQLADTRAYLDFIIGSGFLKNMLAHFVRHSIFYNSFYYLVVTGLLLLGFLAWTISRISLLRRLPAGRYWVPSLVALAALSLMMWPNMLSVSDLDLSAIVFALILAGTFLSPALTSNQRDVVAWLACSFLGYNFVVRHPMTHIHIIYPPWVLLGGLAAARLWQIANDKRGKAFLYTCCLVLVLLFGGYLTISYLRHDVEFWEDWPDSRVALYWTPPSFKMPRDDIFGFVHRSGWKGVAALYDSGQLIGDFDSNEKPDVSVWYARNATRVVRQEEPPCGYQPEYYFVADDLVEGLGKWSVDPTILQTGYGVIGRIEVPNGKGLTIYQARPTTGNLGRITIDPLEQAFDRTATPSAFVSKSSQPSHPANVNLHDAIRLIGYDVDLRRANPGGRIVVTLYWRPQVDIPVDLNAFVRLEGGMEGTGAPGIWGESKGVPGCGSSPTRSWRAGQVIVDRHIFPIKPDTPPGDYSILAGMVVPADGTQVDVRDEAGNRIANFAKLTIASIR